SVIPCRRQVLHGLLTRSPLYSRSCPLFRVRLACLIHAASVRSEPGSNSPWEKNGDRATGRSLPLGSIARKIKPVRTPYGAGRRGPRASSQSHVRYSVLKEQRKRRPSPNGKGERATYRADSAMSTRRLRSGGFLPCGNCNIGGAVTPVNPRR